MTSFHLLPLGIMVEKETTLIYCGIFPYTFVTVERLTFLICFPTRSSKLLKVLIETGLGLILIVFVSLGIGLLVHEITLKSVEYFELCFF